MAVSCRINPDSDGDFTCFPGTGGCSVVRLYDR